MTKILAVCPACDNRIGVVEFDVERPPDKAGTADSRLWIDVHDRLPEYPWPVLIFAGRHIPPAGADPNPLVHDLASWYEERWRGTRFRTADVTHWMDLPAAPMKEE